MILLYFHNASSSYTNSYTTTSSSPQNRILHGIVRPTGSSPMANSTHTTSPKTLLWSARLLLHAIVILLHAIVFLFLLVKVLLWRRCMHYLRLHYNRWRFC